MIVYTERNEMIINQMHIKKTKLAKNLLNVAVALMFSTEFLCYTLPGLGIMSFFRISYIIGGIAFVLLVISLFLVDRQGFAFYLFSLERF